MKKYEYTVITVQSSNEWIHWGYTNTRNIMHAKNEKQQLLYLLVVPPVTKNKAQDIIHEYIQFIYEYI